MPVNKASDIDKYIASFPKETQHILEQLRTTIREAAPEAEETINYGVPTLIFKGNLVHFAAYKNHIGFYPAPSGIEAFKKEKGRLPEDLAEIGVEVSEGGPVFYEKKNSSSYKIWGAIGFDKSFVYDSETQKWK